MKGNKFLLKVAAGILSAALLLDSSAVTALAADSTDISLVEASEQTDADDADNDEVGISIDELNKAPLLPTEWTQYTLEEDNSELWFRYALDKPGYMQLDLTCATGADPDKVRSGWAVQVYTGTDLQEPIDSKTDIKMDAYKSNIYSVGTNNIYVHVYNDTANQYFSAKGAPFQLKVTPVTTDNWEAEFNDTIADAMTIQAGTLYKGTMYKPKDKDYYKFVMPETGYFSYEFINDPKLTQLEGLKDKWDVSILDANGNELYTVGKTNNNKSIKMPYEKGTEFLVRVKAHTENTYFWPPHQAYNLTVNFTATDEYETEINDKRDEADNASVGKTINGITGSHDDVDWFAFNLSSKKKAQINFEVIKPEGASESSKYTITVYDKDGKEIQSFSDVCKGSVWRFESEEIALGSGINYVEIKNGAPFYAATGSEYKLTLGGSSSGDESTYTVSYNGLDGVTLKKDLVTSYTWSNKMKAIKLLTKKDLEKKGFTFKGWTDKATGKKTTKITKKTPNNTTFVANWSENVYTITYVIPKKLNGAKVTGKLESVKNIPYTKSVTLSSGAGVTIDNGAKLVGWTTIKNSEDVEYKLGEKVSGLEARNKKKVKLYPVFK